MIPANLFKSPKVSSRSPMDCIVAGGPLPTQAADCVGLYPESLEDMNQKISSSVEGGMEQETTA